MPKTQIDFDANGSGITAQAKALTDIPKHRVIAGSGRLAGASPSIVVADPENVKSAPGFALSLEVVKAGWVSEILINGLVRLSYSVPLGPLYLGEGGRLVGAEEGVGQQLAVGFAGGWVLFG